MRNVHSLLVAATLGILAIAPAVAVAATHTIHVVNFTNRTATVFLEVGGKLVEKQDIASNKSLDLVWDDSKGGGVVGLDACVGSKKWDLSKAQDHFLFAAEQSGSSCVFKP
jgi:hypothetical protein